MSDIIINFINNLCKKSPTYRKVFIKFVNENNNVNEDMIESLYKEVKTYESILKKEKFNPSKYETFESLEDNIVKILEIGKAKTLIKTLLSKKHRYLCDHKTEEIFVEFVKNKISKSAIREFVTSKISRYTNTIEFNDSLNDFLEETIDFNAEKIRFLIESKNLNVKILYDKEDKLIVRVYDYHASNILGSPSWCISYKESYFNQYVKNYHAERVGSTLLENIQLFIWDFSKSPSNKESMIGATYTIGNKYITGHYKNDAPINEFTLNRLFRDINIPNVISDFEDDIIKAIKESGESLSSRFWLVCKYVNNDEFKMKSFSAMINHYAKKNKSINSLKKAFINNFLLFNRNNLDGKKTKGYIDYYKNHLNSELSDDFFKIGMVIYLIKNITKPWVSDVVDILKDEGVWESLQSIFENKYIVFVRNVNLVFGDKTDSYHHLSESLFQYFGTIHCNKKIDNPEDVRDLFIRLLQNNNHKGFVDLFNEIDESILAKTMNLYNSNSSNISMNTNNVPKIGFFLGCVDFSEKYEILQKMSSLIINKNRFDEFIWAFINHTKNYEKKVSIQKTIDAISEDVVRRVFLQQSEMFRYNDSYRYYDDEYLHLKPLWISVLSSDIKDLLINKLIKADSIFPELIDYITKEDVFAALKKSDNEVLKLIGRD